MVRPAAAVLAGPAVVALCALPAAGAPSPASLRTSLRSPPTHDTLESVRDSVVRALEPGERIRVDAVTAYRMAGRFRGVEEGAMVLEPEGPAAGDTALVAVGDLQRLWTEGNRVGEGALWGGVSGAGAGVVLALVVTGGVCEVSCGDDYLRNTAFLAGGGGLVGAAAGAGLGALSTRWSLAFPP